MGVPKATLPFGDETMLARVVRLLRSEVEPIVVVAAPDQELPPLPAAVQVARDRRSGKGPLEGLLAGMAALPRQCAAAFATSCDVPLLLPAFVRRMVKLWRESGVDIVVPESDGFCHPLAAVYAQGVCTAIESLLAADRLRPYYLFDMLPTLRVPAAAWADADPQSLSLRNLNQREDYLRALSQAGFAPPAALLDHWGQRDHQA